MWGYRYWTSLAIIMSSAHKIKTFSYKITPNSMVLVSRQTDRDRQVEQNCEPRNKPWHLWSINLCKGGRRIKWEEESLFSKHCWTAACKTMKLEHTLTPCTKIISKWPKDWNIRQDIIKLLEENTGKTFSDINLMNIFSGQSPKATEVRAKTNGTQSNRQAFAQQRKPKRKQKDNLQNGRK